MKISLSILLALGLMGTGCDRSDKQQAADQGMPEHMQQQEQAPATDMQGQEGTGTGETGAYGTEPEAQAQQEPIQAEPDALAPQPDVLPEDEAQMEGTPAPGTDINAPIDPAQGTDEAPIEQGLPPEPGETDLNPQTQPGPTGEPTNQPPAPQGQQADPLDQGAGARADVQPDTGATAGNMDATGEEPAGEEATGEDSAMTGRGPATTGVGVTGSGEKYTTPEGNSCERVLACYQKLSTDLCADGDVACQGLFQMSSPADDRSCTARLSVVRETARPFIQDSNYQMPQECSATPQ